MMKRIFFICLLCGLLCSCEVKKETVKKEGESKMEFKVTSSAFEQGGMIPAKYTADGEDISPPLTLSGVPEGTKSIALINDDPDAPIGTWVHWVVYNLPPDTTQIAERIPVSPELPNGAKQGRTDFGSIGYGGPAPPSGTHRYFFKVYALDTILDLPVGATKAQLESAMAGHVLAEAQLIGKYKRR